MDNETEVFLTLKTTADYLRTTEKQVSEWVTRKELMCQIKDNTLKISAAEIARMIEQFPERAPAARQGVQRHKQIIRRIVLHKLCDSYGRMPSQW